MKKKLFVFIFICLCFFEIFSENSIKTTNSQSFVELSYAIDFMSEVKFENGKMIISHSEVEVLIAWMKVYWYENMLSNSDNYEDLYTDANIKTFSRANLIDKNTNVLKDARKNAERMESRYSRVNSLRRPSLGDVNND